jgi:3-hydroxyisobutyrate dehydrogenase-like beta-hydroxyacid dehydrogenase
MDNSKIGFIGLGNVGGKLAGSLLPPAASAAVLEQRDGVLAGLRPGTVWLEMSTTDAAEIGRLATLVEARGGLAMDCPVSGGCHRAETGNISIFAGGSRAAFERVLPILKILGRRMRAASARAADWARCRPWHWRAPPSGRARSPSCPVKVTVWSLMLGVIGV